MVRDRVLQDSYPTAMTFDHIEMPRGLGSGWRISNYLGASEANPSRRTPNNSLPASDRKPECATAVLCGYLVTFVFNQTSAGRGFFR